MTDQQTGDQICQEMAQIRGGLGEEVEGIVVNARQLANWRYYVRTFPWASLGAAGAIGYMLVPRRLEIISPDADTLAKLAKDNRLVVEHKPTAEEKPSATAAVAGLLGNILLRAALAYAGQQAGKIFGEQAADPPREQVKAR